MKFRKILITGGAGYVGAVLVPRLLADDYCVTVYDLMIYGENALQKHPNLTVVKGDIRDQMLLKKAMQDQDAVIHLACISNDPSFELNPALGRSINLDAFQPLVEISRKQGVKRFIYASSSSVYGIKKEMDVNEAMTLEPLTDYSRFKAECEKILLDYQSPSFSTVIVRPATVCGYSPRQRLDVIVNILTNLAYNKREITIFGGEQLRPNIHIDDLTDLYIHLIKLNNKKELILNAGFENLSIINTAKIISKLIKSKIVVVKDKNDPRSYRMNSGKLKKINFYPKKNVSIATLELKDKFNEKKLINDPRFYSIKWLRKHLKKK